MEYFSFEFIVKTNDVEQFEEDIFNIGCRDATVIIQNGELIVSFDREADNYKQASKKAREDIEKAGAQVISGPHTIY